MYTYTSSEDNTFHVIYHNEETYLAIADSPPEKAQTIVNALNNQETLTKIEDTLRSWNGSHPYTLIESILSITAERFRRTEVNEEAGPLPSEYMQEQFKQHLGSLTN